MLLIRVVSDHKYVGIGSEVHVTRGKRTKDDSSIMLYRLASRLAKTDTNMPRRTNLVNAATIARIG